MPCTAWAAYRGIADLGALTLAAEVFDWRRFRWRPFMEFTRLVPCENSSGQRTGGAASPHVGNGHLRAQLVEPPGLARTWAAELRLCGKFRPRRLP